jgi:cytoskeletal protein CcmA (bactofilin family)
MIGSSGSIKGEIFAEKLVVGGELDGNADCSNVEILAGGKMNGDLVSSNLIIESNAIFEGYSKIRVAGGGGGSIKKAAAGALTGTIATIAQLGGNKEKEKEKEQPKEEQLSY